MAQYLAQRIIDGIYTYEYVTTRRSDLKPGIDACLTERDRIDLIV